MRIENAAKVLARIEAEIEGEPADGQCADWYTGVGGKTIPIEGLVKRKASAVIKKIGKRGRKVEALGGSIAPTA